MAATILGAASLPDVIFVAFTTTSLPLVTLPLADADTVFEDVETLEPNTSLSTAVRIGTPPVPTTRAVTVALSASVCSFAAAAITPVPAPEAVPTRLLNESKMPLSAELAVADADILLLSVITVESFASCPAWVSI